MSNRIEVNPDVIKYYIEHSKTNLDYLESKEKSIREILGGMKYPTFNQLNKISKAINIPTGLLVLEQPITETFSHSKFRTVGSVELESMSDELRDTIAEMRAKQDFLRDYIEDELPFIGRFDIEENHLVVADEIRKQFNIPIDYFKDIKKNAFTYFREKISAGNVFVFVNGKIKDNTHRALDLKEFRGFVLADKKVPIIFINQKDSKAGMLFTLIHELVHLFIGNDEIYNMEVLEDYSFDKVERFVNKVAAEILVPEKYSETVKTNDIEQLIKIFPVSRFVIIRRKYDLKFISKDEYSEQIKTIENNYTDYVKQQKTGGGNFHNNINYRIDKNFFKYVDNAIKNDQISYTEGFNILGVGYKGYKSIESRRDMNE